MGKNYINSLRVNYVNYTNNNNTDIKEYLFSLNLYVDK